MTLCEKCIHGEICADRDCMDIDDERALQSCNDFKNKADFVEVVRCRDCKYAVGTHAILPEKLCIFHRGSVPEDYYCASGERKEAKSEDSN